MDKELIEIFAAYTEQQSVLQYIINELMTSGSDEIDDDFLDNLIIQANSFLLVSNALISQLLLGFNQQSNNSVAELLLDATFNTKIKTMPRDDLEKLAISLREEIHEFQTAE